MFLGEYKNPFKIVNGEKVIIKVKPSSETIQTLKDAGIINTVKTESEPATETLLDIVNDRLAEELRGISDENSLAVSTLLEAHRYFTHIAHEEARAAQMKKLSSTGCNCMSNKRGLTCPTHHM